jgi:hypothetical protein
MYGPWLYQDIVYVWIVVISEHCLCMNNGHIKTLYGQWLQQDIGYVWHKQCPDITIVHT